ncbi:MAG: CHAT domain-containing protein [Cyanobacteria bacterium J06560_6]
MHFTTGHRHAYLAIIPFLGVALPGAEAYSQIITADDGVGTYVETTGDRIDISGGQVSGDRTNLFHSFEQFDITAEQTANFVTTENIQNVVGRVDSHQASTINGTLQVSGSDANLYLMNPAGVLLGPDAQLNLSGGFTATTATGIGFAEGQELSATGTENYSQLNGTPETFHFDDVQPGAVVNLAELSVDEHKAISLVGGTVVNAGKLSAPEGTVTLAAVEGESLVRISQGNQLLSLEIEASDRSWDGAIAPTQIGEMLTGRGVPTVSELITHADGTVSLSSTGSVIDETGGSAIVSGHIFTEGETGGNINVLGSQVELNNATLNSSGTFGGGLVRIGGDYRGEGAVATATTTLIDPLSVITANALEYGNGGTTIVWGDGDTRFDGSIEATGGRFGGDGGFVEVSGKEQLAFTGLVDVGAQAGRNGNILLDPAHLVITDGPAPANTASTNYVSSTAVESMTGDVLFSAPDGITIESLSDGELQFQNGTTVTFEANTNNDAVGAFSMDSTNSLTSRSGSFKIYGAGVTLGSVNTDISGNAGGNITINSSAGVTATSISTNSYLGSGENDSGGNVMITADGGDIVINNRIKSWSYSNEEGSGGAVTLLASNGNIFVETPPAGFEAIESYAIADRGNAGSGGTVTLLAPNGNIHVDGIRSSSVSFRDNAISGGNIEANANNILVGNINSRAASTGTNALAGKITLEANNRVEVGILRATGSRSGIANEIVLTGETIDLIGGARSIQAEAISLIPTSDSRGITLGQLAPADLLNPPGLPALNIWQQDLAAAGGVATIYVGSHNSTGVVSLFDSAIANPTPIHVLGGQRLVGSNSDTLFALTGPGAGSVGNSQITFANIEQFDGGPGGNNALSFNATNALWKIEGADQGSLQRVDGEIATFQNISQIASTATLVTNEQTEHEVRFTTPDAAITGSITAGNSNLALVGNTITVGKREESNNITGGSISGNGRLAIRSTSNDTTIALGGVESSDPITLSITDGELDAIQAGFIEIVIGDTSVTERITLQDSVSFLDDVSLRSRNNIEALPFRQGRQANIQSTGNVTLESKTGSIFTGGIQTNGRDITLRSAGSIDVEFIDNRRGDSIATDAQILLDTLEDIAIRGSVAGTTDSIASNSTNNEAVRLSFGNAARTASPFVVGISSNNGTANAISTGTESVLTGRYLVDYQRIGNIEFLNRGVIPVPVRTEVPTPVALATAAATRTNQATENTDLSTLSFGAARSEVDIVSDILTNIETGVSADFGTYLGLEEEARSKPVTLIEMQDTLHRVEHETGVTPALVYAYFVPDAGTEDAVVAGSDRPSRPDDQLEIMLVTQNNELIRRRQWGVTRAQVESAGHELREQVTSQFSTERQYLPPAQQLYDWIVRPIEQTLAQREIESIGFVMDTGLRTVPMATLHDGDRYLVESYSLGLLPTFSLTDFDQTLLGDRTDFSTANVLAMGASKFEDQPALPAVEAEVALITSDLWQGDAFLNEDFVLRNLKNQLTQDNYQILHLATHAAFESGDLSNSYIQLWDEQLSLAKMADLQLSESEIGLIILSACSTALGDEASEYGFAGFAVNVGSQSALASLWPVNDEGTLGFMSQFYQHIRDSSTRVEALRQTQISLLSGEVGITDGMVYGPNNEAIAEITELEESGRWDFSHPIYWSAFTMIGNPW